MLTGAEEIARAAEVQVGFGDFEAVVGAGHGGEALLGLVIGGVGNQEAVGGFGSPADAAADLVELGQAKTVGVFDHHDGGVGDVDADFDDGGGEEGIDPAGTEFVHHLFFFVGGELAVNHAQAQAGQGAFGEAVKLGLDAAGLVQAIIFDLRHDDVGLAAFFHLLLDEQVGLGALVLAKPAGLDGLSSRRQFIERADVKICEVGEGEGSGDWGGGHDQVMGRVAFAFKDRALADAELVLLIDDHQAQVGELDVFLDQGLRADREVDLAAGQVLEERALALALGAVGEELDGDAGAFEQPGEGEVMLLGQDFGGGQERALELVGDADEHGIDRDDGFARSHIPLEKARHRALGLKIAENVIDGSLLCAGELEAEALADALVEELVDAHFWGGQPAALKPPRENQAKLHEHQLVVDQAAAGGDGFAKIGGLMDGAKGLLARDETAAVQQLPGKELFDGVEASVEGLVHRLPDGDAAELRGGGVDGAKNVLAHRFRIRLDLLELGLGDLGDVAKGFDLSLHTEAHAGMDDPPEVAAVEPGEGEFAGGVLQGGFEARARVRDVITGDDLATGDLDGALNKLTDGAFSALVLVVAGEILQQVAQRPDANGLERFCARGTDALELLDWPLQRRFFFCFGHLAHDLILRHPRSSILHLGLILRMPPLTFPRALTGMEAMSHKSVGVCLLGCGTVGGGVVNILREQREMLGRRTGIDFELVHVAVKDPNDYPPNAAGLPMTTNANAAIDDPRSQIIVELIGGTGAAGSFIERALKLKKPVVTANKSLLAARGPELFALARQNDTCIAFEASCGGGIPIIDALTRGLLANRIDALLGIVNGTCNFILTKMTQNGWSYDQALKEAQRQGFAEANPAMDVEGRDAAQKLAILSSLAFNSRIAESDIHVEGINNLQADDIRYAQDLGYVIKLLVIAQREAGDQISLRVHPTLVHREDVLADVSGSFNAISVFGHALGHGLWYGRGAGRTPTASAVVSDLISIAMGVAPLAFQQLRIFPDATEPAHVLPFQELQSRYYIRLMAKDEPGVLAQVTAALSRHNISVSAISQHENLSGQSVPVVITTHRSREGSMQQALQEIDALPSITPKTVLLRIIDQPKEFANT